MRPVNDVLYCHGCLTSHRLKYNVTNGDTRTGCVELLLCDCVSFVQRRRRAAAEATAAAESTAKTKKAKTNQSKATVKNKKSKNKRKMWPAAVRCDGLLAAV